MFFNKKPATPVQPTTRVPLLRETVVTDRLHLSTERSECLTVGVQEDAPDSWRVYVNLDYSSNPAPLEIGLATAGLSKERALVVAEKIGKALAFNNEMVRVQIAENQEAAKDG